MCTLMDHDRADRTEWRTTLITRDLARYKVEIAALSETWLDEEGQLSEVGVGYTFFWIGCSWHECHKAGVGFAIKSNLVNKLTGPSKYVNDCLMTV